LLGPLTSLGNCTCIQILIANAIGGDICLAKVLILMLFIFIVAAKPGEIFFALS
jgi:hypothetical protein